MEAFNHKLKVDFSPLISEQKGRLLTEKLADFGKFHCSTIPITPVLPRILNLQYFKTALPLPYSPTRDPRYQMDSINVCYQSL